MKTRKPRPPVGEQGASRAYLEGRLRDPGRQRTAPPSRLEWYGVWSAVAGVSAVLTVGFTFGVTHPRAWVPAYLLVFVTTPLNAVFLRPWARARSAPRLRDRVVAIACAALLATWLAVTIFDGFVWHATGDELFVALASTGFVLFFATVIAAYRGGYLAGRRSPVTQGEPTPHP